MQLQDMLSRISVRHKSTERVSSWHGTGQHCSVFLRHVFWQGIQQRQDSSSRRTWLRCKGMSQVAGATFFHVSIAVREFSGLVCRWRAASVSKNFVRRTEIGEIPDFCKDHSSGVYSHAGNRENWWIELIYDFLNRIFNFVDLGGKFLNEFNGMLQFQRFGRHDRANRSSGCLSNLDGFLFSVASFGRCCKKVCQLGKMDF